MAQMPSYLSCPPTLSIVWHLCIFSSCARDAKGCARTSMAGGPIPRAAPGDSGTRPLLVGAGRQAARCCCRQGTYLTFIHPNTRRCAHTLEVNVPAPCSSCAKRKVRHVYFPNEGKRAHVCDCRGTPPAEPGVGSGPSSPLSLPSYMQGINTQVNAPNTPHCFPGRWTD